VSDTEGWNRVVRGKEGEKRLERERELGGEGIG